MPRITSCFALPALVLALSACGGGNSSENTTSYTLGGSVSSLTGTGLILANGNANTVNIAPGSINFAFNSAQTGSYDVTVFQQPVGQTCAVSNASGGGGSPVNTVAVQCRAYAVFVANEGNSSISQFSIGSDRSLTAADTPTFGTPYRPTALAISSDGTHAWAAYDNNHLISDLLVSAAGELSPLSTTTAGSAVFGPYSLALSPNGTHLYSADFGNLTVSQFSIGSTGLATPMTPATVAASSGPVATVITPDGAHAYVANTNNSTISCYSVGSSGALTALSGSNASVNISTAYGTSPQGLAVDPSGNYLYVTLADSAKIVAYAINSSTGALSYKAMQTTGNMPVAVAVRPAGTYAYVLNYGSNTISQYTLATVPSGAITPLSTQTIATGNHPSALAFSPDSGSVYVTNNADATVSEYTIDPSTGLLSLLGTAPTGTGPTAIVVR